MKNISLACLFLGSFAVTLLFSTCKCKKTEGNDIVVFAPTATIPAYENKPLNTYLLSDKAAVDEKTAVDQMKQLLTTMGEQDNFDLANGVKDGNQLFFINKQDPSASCMINLSNGDISVNTGSQKYMDAGSTPGLVQKDEARKLAEGYLQNLKYANFNDASVVLGHIGGVNMGQYDGQGNSQVYEKFTTVRYNRMLDSILLLGHSRMVVQLAERGKLHGLIRQWADFNPTRVQRGEVVGRDDVQQSIAQHLMGENKGASKITVNKVDLVYYERKGKIEPALHVICQIEYPADAIGATKGPFPYDLVEPILKNPGISYTYMAESPNNQQPVQSNKLNTQEPPKRGDDERKE